MSRRALVFVAVAAAAVGCTRISVLSGPRTLSAGQSATYVLSLGGTESASGVTLHVVADVPSSWTLLSSSYTGTASGVPISGPGTVVPEPYPDLLPSVLDGFQRIWIEDGPFDVTGSDSGEMALEFAVTDVPHGEFVLKFWFVSSADPARSVTRPAWAVVNREPHLFRFVRALGLAAGALEYNASTALSRDGRSLVLGSVLGPDLSVFDRDPLTGELTHNQLLDDPTLSGIDGVAFEPGSEQAYVVSGSSLICYRRDAVTGQLSEIQRLQDGVGGVDGLMGAHAVALSADGASVYAAAHGEDAVSAFDRDPATGQLTFVAAYFNGTGGINGLAEPNHVAVSPDGASVYVTSAQLDALVAFDRDPVSGTLAYGQTLYHGAGGVTGLDNPWDVEVSPDGGHVYAAAADSNSVAVFSRDPGTGELTFSEAQVEGLASVVGLMGPVDLAVTPCGRHVLVGGEGSLVVFDRDPATGLLSFLEADFDGEAGVSGIPLPYDLALSADGSDLVYGSYQSVAVFTVRSFADGFESGGTGRWSTTVP